MEDFDTDRGRFPTSLTSGVHTMENSSHFDGMDVHNEVDEEDDDNAENDVENGNGTTLSSAAAMNPVHINSTSNQHHAASSSTEECDNNDPAEHMRAGGTVVGDIDDSSSTSVSSTTPDVTLHNVIPDRLEDDHNDATDDQHYESDMPNSNRPRKEDNAVTTFAPRNSDTSTTNSVSQSDNHTE
jgi:hypothetical protein